jgi:hypothetical protein
MSMKQDTIIDASLIAAPSSTRNSGRERDPEMHQTKGNPFARFRVAMRPGRRRTLPDTPEGRLDYWVETALAAGFCLQ